MPASRDMPYWDGPARAAKGFPWLSHRTCADFMRADQPTISERDAQKATYAAGALPDFKKTHLNRAPSGP